MHMLDERPELLPGVRRGHVISNAAELADGSRVFAGHPVSVHVPQDVRLKSFALLGGGRPGYEFHPDSEEGRFRLLVDTPGRWTFVTLAAPLQQLGRIKRETSEAILEIFTVNVHAMGKKGEPVDVDSWVPEVDEDEDEDEDEPDSDGESHPLAGVEAALASPIAVQVRRALDEIVRDPSNDGGGATRAATYSWVAVLYKPGTSVRGEPLLRISVENAGPFDPAWTTARQAITEKQKEWEPSRAPVTGEDFTSALRRARVR
jgi:hypothetical protein